MAVISGPEHYTCKALYDHMDAGGSSGMDALRRIFPDASAVNEMNVVLFSTSGVHGSYTTIEDLEKVWAESDEDEPEATRSLTFLVLMPRIVFTGYGQCYPKTPEDFSYLKSLRAASAAALAEMCGQ